MDVLDTSYWSEEFLNEWLHRTETLYPRLKAENDKIRAFVELPHVKGVLKVDVNAALVSDCRSDMLSCGRCAFYKAVKDAGLTFEV